MTLGGPPGGTPDPFAWTQVASHVSGPRPGYGAPPPARPAKTSTLATLSVVFAVVFAPAGVVLGHLALAQIRRDGRRGRRRALLGLGLSYLVIAVAIAALVARPITTTVAGTAAMPRAATAPSSATAAPAAPPVPMVAADALPGFLPSLEEVKQLVNAPNLNEAKDDTKVFDVEQVTYSPPECVTAFGAYELLLRDPAARAAGPMAIYDRSMRGPAPAAGLVYLEETAVRVDGPAVAHTFLAAVLDRWRGCAGRTAASDSGDHGHMEVTVQQPVTRGAVTTLRSNYLNGVSLERAIAVKGNVIVDISAAGKHADDEVNRLAQAIVDRIPG